MVAVKKPNCKNGICAICKKEFKKSWNSATYCSDECRREKQLKSCNEYYYTNLEDCKKRSKVYRENHKEKYKALYKDWANKNKKYRREYRRNYKTTHLEHVRALMRKQIRIYANRNKDKIKARMKTQRVKPPLNQLCQICKINRATQKHHQDYSKPLKLLFLCKVCHGRIHGKDYSDLIKYPNQVITPIQLGEGKLI